MTRRTRLGLFVHLTVYVLAGRNDVGERVLVQRLPQVPAISQDVRGSRRAVFSSRRTAWTISPFPADAPLHPVRRVRPRDCAADNPASTDNRSRCSQ